MPAPSTCDCIARKGRSKGVGAPCRNDDDCRPATAGIARLRCDTLRTHSCVLDARPPAPADYGASCGLPDTFLQGFAVERVVAWPQVSWSLCQVMRTSAQSCLQQGCTIPCTFDEDCPAGSICLCGEPGSPVSGYCAAATDRDTPQGRGAGLAPCP